MIHSTGATISFPHEAKLFVLGHQRLDYFFENVLPPALRSGPDGDGSDPGLIEQIGQKPRKAWPRNKAVYQGFVDIENNVFFLL